MVKQFVGKNFSESDYFVGLVLKEISAEEGKKKVKIKKKQM